MPKGRPGHLRLNLLVSHRCVFCCCNYGSYNNLFPFHQSSAMSLNRKTYYNLSRMTDDEISKLMDSISSVEDTDGDESTGDFDSDDDPAWICPENDELIDECLKFK